MKVGVADYGMNVWDGELFDIEERLEGLKAIGYEGTERLHASSAADAIHKASLYRRLGMDFALCLGPEMQSTIQWTAAFQKLYVWASVEGSRYRNPATTDFETMYRQVNRQVEICARWNIRVALPNHMGTHVESQDNLEDFLEQCPKCGVLLDTAHLAAAGGDCLEVVAKYSDRILAVHVKDWLLTNPEVGLDRWSQRGRFCELGAGNIGLDNGAVVQALAQRGYDGWLFVEHDTHLRDPLEDLAVSRQYLRDAGF